MYRLACCLIGIVFLIPSAMEVRGDIVVSTIYPYPPTTFAGLNRYDETTGTALPAGDIPAASIPLGESFAVPAFPTDAATSSDGRIFVTDGSGMVLHFDGATGSPLASPIPMVPAGVFTIRNPPPTSAGFTSLAFSPGANELLYVLDADDVSGNGDKPGVRIFDPATGAPVDTLLESASVEFTTATSIAFDNEGDLLVSDRDAGTIYKVDVEADTISPFITTGVGPVFGPAGMVVASTGEIYVANLYGNSIVRYDADGTNPTFFAQIPPLPTETGNFPSDLLFNRAEDRLLVAVLGADPTSAGALLSYDLTGTLQDTIASGLAPTSSVVLTPDLLPGDFSGDGNVDELDYDQWKQDFGTNVTSTWGADGNGDGLVNIADYTIWRNSLGATGLLSPSGSQVSNVPEPAAAWMASLAVCGWACWCGRRGSHHFAQP